MKRRKIMIIVASIAVLLSIGGCTVKHKDDTKQGKTIAASSTKDLKEDEETIKKKQMIIVLLCPLVVLHLLAPCQIAWPLAHFSLVLCKQNIKRMNEL